MKLGYTRAMITAVLNGELDNAEFEQHPVFGLAMPRSCPGVPSGLLNPRSTWQDAAAYDAKANELAERFIKNFQQYADGVSEEILTAAPKVAVSV
jgi:phosphoenolpyruvate carboxykinase (ATP)